MPGDVFTPNPSKTRAEISDRIVQVTESLNKVTHHDTKRIFYLPPALSKCFHVFVHDDRVKKPFTAPYFGPFKILDRYDKHYTLDMRSKPTPISIDRLKPCYIFYESQPMSTSHTQQYTPRLLQVLLQIPHSLAKTRRKPQHRRGTFSIHNPNRQKK